MMIKLPETHYNRQDFLLLLFLLIMTITGFWNPSILLFPLLLVGLAFIAGVTFFPAFRNTWLPTFSLVDVALGLLLLLEIFNYQISIYPPNSLPRVEKIIFFIIYYYTLRIFLQKTSYRNAFFTCMSIYALILAIGAFFSFLFLQTYLQIEGWNDASQFKRLFSPYGLLTNEWATIALGLLAFPLLTAIYFRVSKTIVLCSMIAFAIIDVGVIVSFSRGAYLSLGLFWIITLGAILYSKRFTTKNLLKIIAIPVLIITLCTIPLEKPFFTTLAMNKTVSQQRSTQGRLEIMQRSFCQLEGHLVLGIGSDNYPIINDLCKVPREDQGYSAFTNNTYLQILIEKGIVGVVGYVFFMLCLIITIISTMNTLKDTWDRFSLFLLLSGFMVLAFREAFFSALFYGPGILLLMAVITGSAISFTPFRPAKQKDQVFWILLSGALFMSIIWNFYQKKQLKQADRWAAKAIQAWQSQQISAAQKHLEEALRFAPGVAPYHALQGLIAGQRADKETTKAPTLQTAIRAYENAIRLNPYDAGYHFNMAWLYSWSKNPDTTFIFKHLHQALALEPYASEYRIGAGWLLETWKQDTIAAFKEYATALRINPELLDAPFFKAIEKRHRQSAQKIVTTVTQDLKSQVASQPNTILAARLCKFLLVTGDTLAAKSTLQQVVAELPDLNRPYYYLGGIALHEKDTSLAISLLSKSILLDKSDYLPKLVLGDLYFGRLATQRAASRSVIQYYTQALSNWLEEGTLHHKLAAVRYLQSVNVNNDLVVQSLLLARKPALDVPNLLLRIAIAYEKMGQEKLAQHYRMLNQRDPSTLREQDLKGG